MLILNEIRNKNAGQKPSIISIVARITVQRSQNNILQFPLFQSGDIAHHLEFVSHGVRTKLDEIKRREVDRLNQIRKLLMAKQAQDGKPKQPGKGGMFANHPALNLPAQVVDAVLKQQGMHHSQHTPHSLQTGC